jgi:hypothetical protein
MPQPAGLPLLGTIFIPILGGGASASVQLVVATHKAPRAMMERMFMSIFPDTGFSPGRHAEAIDDCRFLAPRPASAPAFVQLRMIIH